MSSVRLVRGLHYSARLSARTKYTKPKPKVAGKEKKKEEEKWNLADKTLSIRSPVPPAAKNIVCPDNHPLWQFFANKKFMRSREELDTESRAWTVPELRRKSFEDLHSLWYTSLKERNILARENHLLKNAIENEQDTFEAVSEKIRTTMWRIRHVLSERDWAFKFAQEKFSEEQSSFIKDFETDFLAMSKEEDSEAFEMLERFQEAVFGIKEIVDENVVDRKFVDGLKCVANLKLQKFMDRNANIKEFIDETPNKLINDVGEAFVIFTSENLEKDLEEACQVVKELRESNNAVSRYDEIETVTQYVKQLSDAQLKKNSESEVTASS